MCYCVTLICPHDQTYKYRLECVKAHTIKDYPAPSEGSGTSTEIEECEKVELESIPSPRGISSCNECTKVNLAAFNDALIKLLDDDKLNKGYVSLASVTAFYHKNRAKTEKTSKAPETTGELHHANKIKWDNVPRTYQQLKEWAGLDKFEITSEDSSDRQKEKKKKAIETRKRLTKSWQNILNMAEGMAILRKIHKQDPNQGPNCLLFPRRQSCSTMQYLLCEAMITKRKRKRGTFEVLTSLENIEISRRIGWYPADQKSFMPLIQYALKEIDEGELVAQEE